MCIHLVFFFFDLSLFFRGSSETTNFALRGRALGSRVLSCITAMSINHTHIPLSERFVLHSLSFIALAREALYLCGSVSFPLYFSDFNDSQLRHSCVSDLLSFESRRLLLFGAEQFIYCRSPSLCHAVSCSLVCSTQYVDVTEPSPAPGAREKERRNILGYPSDRGPASSRLGPSTGEQSFRH